MKLIITRRRPYGIITSCSQILRNLFRPKATIRFPEEHVPLPERFRGAPLLVRPLDCIVCGKCARECPTHCIHITDLGEGEFTLTFNLAQCMYCGVCAEGCSRSAIEMSNQWLLAGVTKDALLRTYSVRRLQKKKPAMKPTEVPPNA